MKRILATTAMLAAALATTVGLAGSASAAATSMACDNDTVDYYTSLNWYATSGAITFTGATWTTSPNAAMDRLTWSVRSNGTITLIAAAGASSATQNDVSGASGGVYDFTDYTQWHFGTRTVEVKASQWGGVGSDASSCGSVWHTIYTP